MLPKKTYANNHITGVHRKAIKKLKKIVSIKNHFHKYYPKDSINGGTQERFYREKFKNQKGLFFKKSVIQKTISKVVPMRVHRKVINK